MFPYCTFDVEFLSPNNKAHGQTDCQWAHGCHISQKLHTIWKELCAITWYSKFPLGF